MPAYDFICKRCDERTEWVGSFSSRPDDIECEHCSGFAVYTVMEREKAPVKVRGSARDKNTVWRELECECGWSDIDEFEKSVEEVPCQDCFRMVKVGMLGSHSRLNELRYGQTGRFDRGLDCWVESEAHRRAICKAKGITPVEDVGDAYLEKRRAARSAEEEREKREYAEYENKVENSPTFSRYRELRSRGYVDDLFAD